LLPLEMFTEFAGYNGCMLPVISLGYVCVCGQRVTVFQLKGGQANELPPTITVACKQGHVASFDAKHIALLEHLPDEQGVEPTSSQCGEVSGDFKKAA
jgi:hypothetical protein